MKKLISILLSFTLVFSTVLFCVKEPLKVKAEEALINSFVNDTLEMIKENDKDKKFIPDDESETATLSTQSFDDSTNNVFQTCRLIVQAEKEIEKLNSTAVASGFMDYYIVQFETETDAENAYKYYSECDYISSVAPDKVYSALSDYSINESSIKAYSTVPTHLDSWGSKVIGSYDLLEYINSNLNIENLPELKIAVIDTGVDLEHEFLQGRLIETGFNVSASGESNSEVDTKRGHGTATTSVIVDNTPPNVKIANYRVLDDDGTGSVSGLVAAILQASLDESDIINMSLRFLYASETEKEMLKDAVDIAIESGCYAVCSSGNDGNDNNYYNTYPANLGNVLTVAASNEHSLPASFSNRGLNVNVLAPGEEMPVASPNNTYITADGTSISSPITAAVFAMLKILYPDESNEMLKRRIESTASKTNLLCMSYMYGYGIIDAVAAAGLERARQPVIHNDIAVYNGKASIEITAPENCEVYYTLDETYPSKENGILYTEPIEIEDSYVILQAVTFCKKGKEIKSGYESEFIKSTVVGTPEMFKINEDGIITEYKGDVNCLLVPEQINGIKVTGFADSVFSDSTLELLKIPDTIETIPAKFFYNNSTISCVHGEGIREIQSESFYKCTKLYDVYFPNVQTVGDKAFYGTRQLSEVDFPECTYIGQHAFYNSIMRRVYIPKAETISAYSFKECDCIYEFYAPSIKELRRRLYQDGEWIGNAATFDAAGLNFVVDLENITELAYASFWETQVTRLEFSNVTVIESLPIGACQKPFYSTNIAVLPSTLSSCALDVIPYWNEDIPYEISYKVYGTTGTYAEQWAIENAFEFIEISQSTAVITDLPTEYYSYMRPLEADVVGFNRTYQWYGSDENDYAKGIAIKGATSREFDPNNFKSYKYYYCEVTSTDVGYVPIKIKTGICENKSYKPYVYTPEKYDASIKIQMPETRYLEYGESITLYASSTGLPDGANIRWRVVDGTGVSLSPTSAGNYCRVTAESSGNAIIEAYAVNKQGNLIYNLNGNRISDRTGISSEVTLWMIILQFIKKIFPFIKTTISNLS